MQLNKTLCERLQQIGSYVLWSEDKAICNEAANLITSQETEISKLKSTITTANKRIAELEAKAANLTEFLHVHITRIAELEAAPAATAVLP